MITFFATTLLVLPALADQGTPPFGAQRTLSGDRLIAPAAGVQWHVDVAATDWGYLAVWEDDRASLSGNVAFGGQVSTSDIMAARYDLQGNPLDAAPILVSAAPFSQEDPKVAWNGTTFLVVWESESLSAFWKSRNVVAARIAANGELLDPAPIVIDDQDYVDEHPWDVASDGTDFLVLWQDESSTGGWALNAARVDGSGAIVQTRTILAPSNQFSAPWNVSAEFASDRYLLTWSSFNDGISGYRLDSGLTKVGNKFQIGTSTDAQPKVASDGTGFFVTWGEGGTWGEVRGTPVSASGSVAVAGGRLLTPGVYPIDPHPSPAWDGSGWHVLWEAWGFGFGFSIHETRVTPSGAISGGPDQLVAHGEYAVRPVAANGNGWVLASWEDGRESLPGGPAFDLYSARINSAGTLGPEFALNASIPAQLQPDVALNDDHSAALVVFQSRTSGRARILAQRVDAFGRALDAEAIEISSGSPDLRLPAVSWNGSLWLVVWEDYAGSVFQSRILGRRVAADGSVLDPAPLDLMPGNRPDVAAFEGNFLVAATHEPTNHLRYAKAVRVRGSDGVLLDSNPMLLSDNYARNVAVEAMSDRWVVAWQENGTHDNPYADIGVNFVLAGGTSTGMRYPTNSTGFEYAPALAAAGDLALLVWQDGENLRGARLRNDGSLVDPAAGFMLSTAGNDQFGPAVSWDGLQWMSAWTDWRAHDLLEPGLGDVFGTAVRADASVVNPGGMAIAAGPLSEGDVRLSGGRGMSLAVWTEHHGASPDNQLRITLAAQAPQLQVPALVRGQPAALQVLGAQSGDTAWFLWSRVGRGPGPCVVALGNLCLDLRLPVNVVGSAAVGPGGTATLNANVPVNAPLIDLHLQAALMRSPATMSAKTDIELRTIQP